MRTAPRLLVLLPVLAAATVLGALLVQPGCSASQCKQPDRATGPTASFECPSGQVCYEGQCRKSCNAGAELDPKMICNNSGDCKDPSLPNCVATQNGLFCSSCSESETCVPDYNICQPVTDVIVGDGGSYPMIMNAGQLPNAPLDGAQIDGSTLVKDSEPPPPPPPQLLTHVGHVEVIQVTDYSLTPMATEQPSVSIAFQDIRAVVETSSNARILGMGDCDLDDIRTFSTTAAVSNANLGSITIDTSPASPKPAFAQQIAATFNMTTNIYDIMPSPAPNPLLELSTPTEDHFAAIVGMGSPMVTLPWPSTAFAYHVPYKLTPSSDTLTFLRSGVTVTAIPQDISFTWTAINPGGTGFVGEKVIAELRGKRHRIHCESDESLMSLGRLTMNSALISELRRRDGLASGENAQITFGRVEEQELGIPGITYLDTGGRQVTTAIEATIRFGSVFYGRAAF
jgi:hypothetical protein